MCDLQNIWQIFAIDLTALSFICVRVFQNTHCGFMKKLHTATSAKTELNSNDSDNNVSI